MRDGPLVDWGWIGDHLDDVRVATLEHLRLTLIALVVGFAVAAVLAVIGVRWRWTLGPIVAATGVIYTIPSLALFALLVPVTGLGTTLTAEIALVGYTLLILVRNIVTGIDGVPPAVRDAADGMGMTRRRRLVAVELPLAAPAIFAGLRIASVTTVGLVTVTSLVGLGGYGGFIRQGLTRQFPTQIILGGGLAVVMAVVFDLVLVAAERGATPWARSSRRSRRADVVDANAGTFVAPGLGLTGMEPGPR